MGRTTSPPLEVARAERLWSPTVLGAPAVVWSVGLLASVAMIGPGLGPGAWMNLDLLLFDELPVPEGMWGLGPELPRRVPLGAILAWVGAVTGGLVAGKAFVVAMLTTAFVGAYVLALRVASALAAADDRHRTGDGDGARRSTVVVAVGASATALLWAFGPFLLTRVAVGHWPVAVVMAVLPWAILDLVRPWASWRRVAVWAVVFCVAGLYGALVGGAFLLTGVLLGWIEGRTGPKGGAAALALWSVGQLPWLMPMVVVAWGTGAREMAASDAFRTPAAGLDDLGRLFAGAGFWNPGFQLGAMQGGFLAVAGLVLAALAVHGAIDLPVPLRTPLLGLAAVSFVVVVAGSTPVLDGPFTWFTSTPVGAVFREAQRFLVPVLLWVAVAAPLGARRLARRVPAALAGPVVVLPLVIGAVVAAPSLWGLEGQVRPVEVPEGWAAARRAVHEDPGTVVALPWFQYFTADVADDRLVLDPLPLFLGGDVISASDPELLDRPTQEVGDPREPSIRQIVGASRQGQPVAGALASVGVRWVALQHDVDWRSYRGVLEDPDLEVVVDGPTLTLYRVAAHVGGPVDPAGRPVDGRRLAGPLEVLDGTSAAFLERPYQWGWLRGTQGGWRASDGRLAFDAGSGVVWFWPAVIVLIADLVALTMLACALAVRPRRAAGRRHRTVAPSSFTTR